MSDLSRLLGDVYGAGPDEDLTEEAVPARDLAEEAATGDHPAWADESVLDEAFADWVPGPPAEAPAAERAALSELATEPVPDVPVPETLAEALPEAAEWFFDVPAPTEAAVAAVVDLPSEEHDADADVVAPVWQRSDDDLLPAKGRGRRRR